MVKIQELGAGDELQCWMRPGLAVYPVRKNSSGSVVYAVPTKPRTLKTGDLTRFVALVMRNDVDNGVLSVHLVPSNSLQMPVPTRRALLVADIHYTAFKRVRRFSTVSFPGTPEVPGDRGGKGYRRPGSIAPFGGTAHRAYKTVEEVKL